MLGQKVKSSKEAGMSAKVIARRFFDEVWSEGKLELADELFASDYIGHPSDVEETVRGPEAVKQYVRALLESFSDLRMTIEDQVAEGDKVVTRWTARGTHDGNLMGTEPTGRTGTVTGITIQRIRDDKVVEGWTNWDVLGMLQQLGLAPQLSQG
jgi:steroid delta-isomerase-like uncharacterized protein